MKKILKQLPIMAILVLIGLLSADAIAMAQAGSGLIGPGGAAGSVPGAVLEATGGQGSIRALALTIIEYFLGFLGLLAVIMIIYAGVLYVTAGGADEQTGKAKKIIMYAIVGLLIVMLSWAIVYTILGAGLGQETA